ncbi:MAG: GGDEF domain-containing protein [Pseudobutyrivibrio sp.]|nr:GGDEF domain-containing protein [Pseudobutyrivibrio sp.]
MKKQDDWQNVKKSWMNGLIVICLPQIYIAAIQKELTFVLNQLYSTLFDQQNYTLAGVVNGIVYTSINELQISSLEHKQYVKRISLIFVVWFIGLFILAILLVQISNSRYDNLTELFNRNMFNYTLSRMKRSNIKYGIIMMDIDDFKQVNDNYGHLNGDIVLKRLGQIISKETTNEIKAYRYGGEEFIVLVEKPVLPYIKAISQRIRRHMEEQEWEFNKDLVLTISIGCAIGSGEDDVVKKADDNLYISKTNGKNQVTM